MSSGEVFLPSYDTVKFSSASHQLSLHMNNKEFFSPNVQSYRIAVGITIEDDFSTKNRRNSFYSDCTVIRTNFESSGYLGSTFLNTTFTDCNFSNANFHSCNFENVTINTLCDSYAIDSAGFHKSTFSNVIFENINFFSTGFTDALFMNCLFISCSIRLCSLEGAQFTNCKFSDTQMRTLNLEYVQFENVKFDNVLLPFAPLPFLFKGLKDILASETANIYSATSHTLSPDQYKELLASFLIFYINTKNYFPVANIYLVEGKTKLAFKAVAEGIIESLKKRDFRILKHYTRLVYIHNAFTKEMRLELLSQIMEWADVQNFSVAERHSFDLNIGSVRQMLVYDNYDKPTLRFTVKTDITDRHQTHLILSTLTDMLPEDGSVNHFIEMRRNSPDVFDIVLVCQDLIHIFRYIALGYAALKGISKFIDLISETAHKIQDIGLKHQQHKLNQQQIALNELTEHEKSLSIEKQKLDIEKLSNELDSIKSQAANAQRMITSSSIEIIGVEHIISNTPYIVDKKFLEYKSR